MAMASSCCFDLNTLPPQINLPLAKVITDEDLEMKNLGIVNWSPFCWDLNVTPPQNSYGSLPLDLVRDIGRQLLKSIAVMHELQFIHTDLKPENILLVSSDFMTISDHKHLPTSNAIKVIDFGSSTSGYQKHRHLITTRPYRAPEVILDN
ncbi:hypothetical protein ZIOFF_014608 [Zingiber officinale]|uniref:Protein kinase domain-containing protein n=1 Tax=Zingiber officinale TaxID=94328 RepID=A0A8J5HWL5_ZINOF|nr:hypothetical protein ZIOFF_014608 [Zingiber officinale]